MADAQDTRHLEERFDALMEPLDAPILVVTTNNGAEIAGCVVGFHTQCSIGPKRFAVWLSKANRTYRVATFADRLAVHFLDSSHRELAELFGGVSGDDVDKFTRCDWTAGPGGVPLLDRVPNRVIGRKVCVVDDAASDHICVMLAPEVVETQAGYTPLRLTAIADIVPGHDADEEPVPDSGRPLS